MPLQNRVIPTGEIVADKERGAWTGNRGILPFDEEGRLGLSRWTHKAWIICSLTHPRGTYHGPRPSRGWTPLFFLDEAVALAAGHRPCAYCRRDSYAAFKAASGNIRHDEIDRRLHAARCTRRREKVTVRAEAGTLPDGAFIHWQDEPWLVRGRRIFRFTTAGYDGNQPRPQGIVTVLTPAPTIDALVTGYRPEIHESAFS